jgi:hypothetical protein
VSQELAATKIKTPIGALWLVSIGEKIWSAEFEPRWVDVALRLARKGSEVEPGAVRKKDAPILVRASGALADYFEGDLDALRHRSRSRDRSCACPSGGAFEKSAQETR